MSNNQSTANRALFLAQQLSAQPGGEEVSQMLRHYAQLLNDEQLGRDRLDAQRYRHLAVMENTDWVAFNIPASLPGFALNPSNRKPFLDEILDKALDAAPRQEVSGG